MAALVPGRMQGNAQQHASAALDTGHAVLVKVRPKNDAVEEGEDDAVGLENAPSSGFFSTTLSL